MSTVLELLALLEVLATWLIVCLRYQRLPAMIHSPFNGGGDAHGMAGKEQLWLLLILTIVLYLFLTGIPRIPELPVNVPSGTSPQSIELVRRWAFAVLLGVKFLVMGMFLVLASRSTGMVSHFSAHLILLTLSTALLVLALISAILLFRKVRG